jgi:[ribosomal protein S18]-alanine N-acetyltransferase
MSLPILKVVQRSIIRGDLPALIEIERTNALSPWTEAEFRAWFLGPRKSIGIICMTGHIAVGFVVYEIGDDQIEIQNMAVRPAYRRRAVASQMLARLGGKLTEFAKPRLVTSVRDSNLPMHLFLRSRGFRATEVCHGHCENTGEDGYRFEYLAEQPVTLCAGIAAPGL